LTFTTQQKIQDFAEIQTESYDGGIAKTKLSRQMSENQSLQRKEPQCLMPILIINTNRNRLSGWTPYKTPWRPRITAKRVATNNNN
jgi:hypothetical protein